MPDYFVIEKKLGPVREVETLPVVTAASPEDACKIMAEDVKRAGTYYAVEVPAVVEVSVEAEVSRVFTATRVVATTREPLDAPSR